MRSELLLSLSVAGAVCLGMVYAARAQDDVYIDLSVLNSLQQGTEMTVQPLFPEVKEKPAVKKKLQKKPVKRRTVKKKQTAVAGKAEISAQQENMEKAGSKTEARPSAGGEKASTVNELKQAIENNPVKKEQSSIPENEKAESATSETEENILPEDANKGVLTPAAPVVVTKTETTALQPAEKTAAESVVPPVQTPAENNISRSIVFGAESSDLTEADKQQIDAIIAAFEDIENSKIAITSYNLDDGKDVFYRKKQSLDRAIAVRSYLLRKGYKNYSIKVINIPAGDPRVNTVDVVELR